MKKAGVVTICCLMAVGILIYPSTGYGDMGKMNLEDKVMKKLHTIFMSKEELALSEDQIEKLKEMKIDTKKELIRKNADIEIMQLDIESNLWQDEIDVNAVNALIDKKYEVKKAKAKMLVDTYSRLKLVLTEKQKEKLKGIYKNKMIGQKRHMMGAGKSDCPMNKKDWKK
ncbi:Spy/CpxP family protein refolding chaperone [Elusimicrobiota bacterium]